MKDSILRNKSVLVVDGDEGVVEAVQKSILCECPECCLRETTNFIEARQLILNLTFDLVIMGITNPPGSLLSDFSLHLNCPVLVLCENGTSPESVKKISGINVQRMVAKKAVDQIHVAAEKILKSAYKNRWERALTNLFRFLCRIGPGYGSKGPNGGFRDKGAIYY